MRFVIASDLHGSPESLVFLTDRVRELHPDRTVLLGDILYHGPRNPLPTGYGPRDMPTLFLSLMDLAPLTCVRGNCDAEVDLMILPFPLASNCILAADGLQIYASHGHRIPEFPPMPGFKTGTVFLRGHTHVPRGETIDGYHFWNPGSLTLPKHGCPRSWAVYENGTFTVFDMQGREVLQHSVGA